jgi:opacity protein-like surface antigen
MKVTRSIWGATLLSASILSLSQAAWAADFYGKAPEPVPQAYADWSGLSIFGTVGYGWFSGNTAYNATDNIPGGTGQQLTFANTIGLPLSYNIGEGALQGGGGIGLDKQFGQLIVGINTSWIFTGASAGANGAARFDNIGDTLSIQTQTALNQYGSTQFELGWQPRRDLPLAGFLHGGWAYADISHTDMISAQGPFINLLGGPFATEFNTTKTQFGPVVGAKLEYMITRQWIAGVDYEHVFFGSFDANVPLLNGSIAQSHTNISTDSVRVNIKYLIVPWF